MTTPVEPGVCAWQNPLPQIICMSQLCACAVSTLMCYIMNYIFNVNIYTKMDKLNNKLT